MNGGGEFTTHDYDVVVIGAGGAGLRAAVEASAKGAKTALVCKSLLGKAHTVMAEGGAAAALGNADARDNWKVHFRDTMRGGRFLNNWKMAELHAKEAPDRVRELEMWGAVWDRDKAGWINQRAFGGHAYRRLAHVGDRTGLEIIRTLQDKGVHSGIDVFMEHSVVKLYKSGDRVTGALAYERETGKFKSFRCGAIVLATGGIGRCYKVTSNSWEYTADGQALAFEAGADLMDMEFVQFHPTGMVWPPSVRGILVTEGVRGEGGQLRNSKGERFMFRYVPDLYRKETAETEDEGNRWILGDKSARRPPDLLPRDIVARAIRAEIKAGRGSPRDGVYLDISWRDEAYIKAKLPGMYHQFKELAGVDITEEAMEIAPTMHYHMGGIRVDAATAMTTVNGLFAAGEVAAGLHGSNRLGGNSLSDLLVFGRRAGEFAAKWAKEHPVGDGGGDDGVHDTVAWATAVFDRASGEGENPFSIQEELQEVMHEYVGMIRTRDELETALERLEQLKLRADRIAVHGSRQYNGAFDLSFSVRNLLVAAEAVARSALAREESRGAHTRDDFPDYAERLGKVNIVCRKDGAGGGEASSAPRGGRGLLGGDAMRIVQEPLPPMPAEMKAICDSTLETVSTPEVKA